MRKSRSGFTIVELLIVIVVIAILAAISIVAYNGIQQRSNNTKTIGAVVAYVKALNFYKVDNGQYPPVSKSCLGSQSCDSVGSFLADSSGFNTSYLSRYLGSSVPEPAANAGTFTTGRQLSGAGYAYNDAAYGGTNNGGIGFYYQGASSCPTISGLTFVGMTAYSDGSGTWCRYSLG